MYPVFPSHPGGRVALSRVLCAVLGPGWLSISDRVMCHVHPKLPTCPFPHPFAWQPQAYPLCLRICVLLLLLLFLVRTFKFYAPSRFQLDNTVLPTLTPKLYVRSSDFIHLIAERCTLLQTSPFFSSWQPATFLLSVSISLIFFFCLFVFNSMSPLKSF